MSTKYQSRFLWSAASDFAKLLQTVGVDSVVSIDLQRAGQGHEGCFFDSQVPIETINSTELMADYFSKHIPMNERPVVVVSANANCMKKAITFRNALIKKGAMPPSSSSRPDHACFVPSEKNESQFLGNVEGSDVIIVDELVETANRLSELCTILKRRGAQRIYLCASHGLFTKDSKNLIDLSPVEKVVVTDTVPLSKVYPASDKIVQIPVAPLIAKVIDTDYFEPEVLKDEQLDLE